ncbi:MAG: hypothetical protein HYV26_12325, partial [Candidatus Hydrogenedentes bacterium]|nr:hypothetical protein [Candidatus Hydrogenedentota bacterium]
MPEAEPAQLRLYCICGQKMRVSASMFGKPGKCVACRQKIRIPRLDEIPADNPEVYLKDHPEFLRKPPRQFKSNPPPESEKTPSEDVQLLGDATDGVPLDDLPPLRLLTSYDHKIQAKLKALKKSASNGGTTTQDKAAFMSYRGMVRKARTTLDEQLNAMLEHTRDQITAVEEEIARSSLAVRTGEMPYLTYHQQMAELRQQREWHVRRRHNLRAWLHVRDPHLAGGFMDLPLEDVPIHPPAIELPGYTDSEQPLVNTVVEQLREALRDREVAARRRAEWGNMSRSGSLVGPALLEADEETRAFQRRAAARVGFARGRLEQFIHDCESDGKALKAQLKLARERLQDGTLTKNLYQSLEMDLLRAQADNTKVHDFASRALHANTASDVPHLRGSFLLRVAHSRKADGVGLDSWLAWTTALVLFIGIFVPIIPDAPGANMVVLPGLVMAQVVFAAFLGMAGAIGSRNVRARVLNGIFVVACIGCTWYLKWTWSSESAAGAAMRLNPRWYLSLGVLLLLTSGAMTAAAAGVSAVPVRRLWKVPVVSGGVTLAALILILSNFGGAFSISPRIDEPEIGVALSEFGPYNTTVSVGNEGWRSFWLTESEADNPAPVRFFLERRIGASSWQDAGLPGCMRLSDTHWWDPFGDTRFPATELPRGATAFFRYALVPGTYRIQVIPPGKANPPLSKVFEVAESMAITDEIRLPGTATPQGESQED